MNSVLIFAVLAISARPAFAYIDAGTSGLLFQLGYLIFIFFFSLLAFIPKKLLQFGRKLISKLFRNKDGQGN